MTGFSDAEFARIAAFMEERYGINLERKKALVEARLSLEMAKRGFENCAQYVRAALSDPDGALCQGMVNRLSTNYTFFFREPTYVDYFNAHLLPGWPADRALHIWCAGCATGQEPYSVAMTVERYARLSGRKIAYDILATDINAEALRLAAEGVYPIREREAIPPECRVFLESRADAFAVADSIRARIRFRRENLLESGRSTAMDVILCRNVMIYFRAEVRDRVAVMLNGALRPGGCLIVGSTESIDWKQKLFERRGPFIYGKRTETP